MSQHDVIYTTKGQQKIIDGQWNKNRNDYNLNNDQIHFLIIVIVLAKKEKHYYRINRNK